MGGLRDTMTSFSVQLGMLGTGSATVTLCAFIALQLGPLVRMPNVTLSNSLVVLSIPFLNTKS